MGIEALWSLEFESTNESYGAGVVVFETEKIFGGDSLYYYLGNYKTSNGILEAEIEVTHYFGSKSSIFGELDKFKIKLTGKFKENLFYADGYLVDDKDKKVKVKLTKQANLP
jgi:hypothetical protein